MLWPTTAPGSMPQDRHRAVRPTCSANKATCVMAISSAAEPRISLPPGQFVAKRKARLRRNRALATRDRFPEGRLPREQLSAHAPPLRALSGIHEGKLAFLTPRPAPRLPERAAQAFNELRARAPHNREPVVM